MALFTVIPLQAQDVDQLFRFAEAKDASGSGVSIQVPGRTRHDRAPGEIYYSIWSIGSIRYSIGVSIQVPGRRHRATRPDRDRSRRKRHDPAVTSHGRRRDGDRP